MESIQTSLQISPASLASLCTAFLQSPYYSKAISDARYERMQAIHDFLTKHFSSHLQHLNEQALDELALSIRENYYRYF